MRKKGEKEKEDGRIRKRKQNKGGRGTEKNQKRRTNGPQDVMKN